MPLRLKTKFTLTTALLVLCVAALTSFLYLATLVRTLLDEARDRARFVTQQVYLQAQHALADAAEQGLAPASDSPEDLREYVRSVLDSNEGVRSQIAGAVGYLSTIYEVNIVGRQGLTLISSDPARAGLPAEPRKNLDQLASASWLEQLRALYGPAQVYEVSLGFNLGGEPFGEIRAGVITTLLRDRIAPRLRAAVLLALLAVVLSTAVAALASHFSLRPLARISEQLDRMARDSVVPSAPAPQPPADDPAPADELGAVRSKIDHIEAQMRGAREVFSTLRENLNQVMAGLDDALLLFAADGRNVLATPAVERLLGATPDSLLGKTAREIFPEGHPFCAALRFEGSHLLATQPRELTLNGAGAVRRVQVRVQALAAGAEGASRGAVVVLRDVDSIERLGSQIEVSERLAALGRVTAGVAHEVKNPLNSMRLWIENLKEHIPPDEAEPRRAVQILDAEIDRLDRVVRTFLDFTRPVQLHLEETSLESLCREVLLLARPQIEKARVEIRQDFEPALPPVRVDRALLKQALLNLVLNACEAMPDGGSLTLSVRRRSDMGQISVSDTGCGIPPEFQGKIFQLYFTTRKGGSGIGLATTYRIVQLHNGSIDFHSEVGRGTTFRMEFPLARSAAPPQAAS
jgi:PAS domain S-box-containing protein